MTPNDGILYNILKIPTRPHPASTIETEESLNQHTFYAH
jgi:hypothetical protein